ncbi:MAG: CDP-glycerol glycerophosphotransferase family protein [Butyribacter sp.]|nr:CDP-glycerol glycerophosphotransferase family protein [bacterium]MDY3853682.1 CDP-glycerol glycerophosphotransferase family protein [Butyribacter sp.]
MLGKEMQDTFTITKKEIDDEKKELAIEAKGTVLFPVANQKLRIICVFVYEEYERRFPIEAECTFGEGQTLFEIKQVISLPDVFYQFKAGKAECVEVSFVYCDAIGKWHSLPETLSVPTALFGKEQKKQSWFARSFRKLAYVVNTVLLPVWMFDGWLAVKGYKESAYIPVDCKGKKGIFYHAQGIVKKRTGYGYSLRELKTNYFRKQYEKSCKKIAQPEGFCFLSEREMEAGGNLGIVRKEIIKSRAVWTDCIDSRPIDKLPFSQIRQIAEKAAGAKVIVLEDFYPQIGALTLRKETKLVQLWHACGAFKMFGLSGIAKKGHLEQSTRNHRSYSYAFVSGKQMVPFYSEAFGIPESRVLPLGVPRTDRFFEQDYKENVRERLFQTYPQLKDRKVVLFAPTFRNSGNKNAYYPTERFLADAFLEQMPEDTVLIIKNHPFVKEKWSYDEKYENRVLDLTGKEDINDLLFVTSLLITDYSSSIFEAALLKIPMLFYVFDLEEYISSRDFYFDFASFAPGVQVSEWEDLLKETKKLLQEQPETDERLQAFCDYFMDGTDGNSTKKIVDFLLELEKTENPQTGRR